MHSLWKVGPGYSRPLAGWSQAFWVEFAVAPVGDRMQSKSCKDVRHRVNLVTRLVHPDGSTLATCLLRDVSATGARLKLDDTNTLPEQFLLLLSHNGELCRHCVLQSQEGRDVNVRFVPPPRKRAVLELAQTPKVRENLDDMPTA